MAITKTKFINYNRCPYYYFLDNVNHSKLNQKVTYEEYFEEQNKFKYEVDNEQLKLLLPYYKECEVLATSVAQKYFTGTFTCAYDTALQECFECKINGNLYSCYVDIYNETDDGKINIFEVKATTSDKFEDTNFFSKKDNIYKLNKIDEKVKKKLLNKNDNCGKYIYDIAIQRYIIEHDLKKDGLNYLINDTNYYLGILNSNYVYDGKKDANNNPIYEKDCFGNELITFIDVNEITKLYLPIIDEERKNLENIIKIGEIKEDIKVGDYCNYKSANKCPFCDRCFSKLPEKNSVLTILDSQFGFKSNDKKLSVYDLINNGMYKITDVPLEYLTRKKNIIQREVIMNKVPYFNLEKIKDGLSLIKYPIYHLDFETFPSPLPRFRGERCYTQSVFQFSLHIETKKGCDKETDHYGYLADSLNDCREELVKKLCSLITTPGTVLVYNSSFEKNRLRELATIFPEYKDKLDYINNMVFDLLDVIKSNKKIYMNLGYSEEDSKIFNFYHEDLNGSFSIKKVLPIFSDLSYKNLEVSNGVEAYSTYLTFDKLNDAEKKDAYNNLIEYCKQDTWAMVEILHHLKELSSNVK